tara:strand:+ start:284 stop:589 length:306 start_codon:yes stop_codon:yes gene_type:complete
LSYNNSNNKCEKLAKNFLTAIHQNAEIIFEPNGQNMFPDFKISKKETYYECTEMVLRCGNKPIRSDEESIKNIINNIIDKHKNTKTKYWIIICFKKTRKPI